jgi:DNA polymerase
VSIVTIDFETYYDQKYSLKQMTPVEYILDPRFEVLGAGIVDKAIVPQPFWMDGEPLRRYLEGLRERESLTVVSHNSLFDMCILHWCYGTLPDLMIDTLGMARSMIYAHTGSISLNSCAAHFGLAPKGDTILKVAGMHRKEMEEAGFWQAFTEYAKHDAYLAQEIFLKMALTFPKDEYKIMDMVLRCAVDPQFVLDREVLMTHLAEIKQEKEQLLTRAGILDKKELLSNEKFANALRGLGIQPPMKTSPATGKETYAFAKSDPMMQEFTKHPRSEVQALVGARVGIKSTLEETRTEKLIRISNLDWQKTKLKVPPGQAFAPIPLRYSGAHTHRLSGDWKLNAQNWTKAKTLPDGSKVTGRLRLAHRAPPGYLVVKCDASQIEARIVAWLSKQDDLVNDFAKGEDIYSKFAEESIYNYPVSKTTVDERFVGKSAILGLGFQVGAAKFQKEISAKSFVTLGHSIELSLEDSQKIVGAYRNRFPRIVQAWAHCGETIKQMQFRQGLRDTFDGIIGIGHEALILPNGHKLFYPGLHFKDKAESDDGYGSWVCRYGKEWKKLFGGKVWENIVQALARIITMNAAREMLREGFQLAHQIHDDLIYVVPEKEAYQVAKLLELQMSIQRDWYRGLPLAAEAGIGPSYGECK